MLPRAKARPVVDGLPRAVNHSAQQIRPDAQRWLRPSRYDAVTIANPARPLQRHRQYRSATKPDDLSRKRPPILSHNRATFTDRAKRPVRLDQMSNRLGYTSG